MATQQLQRDPSLPRSISIWGDELKKIKLPDGKFDPAGQWSQLYTQYSLGPISGGWRSAFRTVGALRLERMPDENGGFTQRGRHVTQMIGKTWLSTEWIADYGGNRLATPWRWSFTSDLLFNFKPVDKNFRYQDVGPTSYQNRSLPMASAKNHFTGRVEGDEIINEGCSPITLAPTTKLAVNWGVFDAVQRLESKLEVPLTFDMLEDFDLHKPGQTLRSGGALTVEFAGESVRLHSFLQTGWGILPWEYWLNEQGRLVLAVGGFKGYVLNPAEPIGEKL